MKEMRPFLGYTGVHRHLIKDFYKIAKLLTSFLTKYVPFHFGDEGYLVFNGLKEPLTSALILHPPFLGNPLI